MKCKRQVLDNDNIEHWIHDLNETDWDCILSLNDIHCMYNNYLDHVKQLYRNFPVLEVKYRYDKSKSW